MKSRRANLIQAHYVSVARKELPLTLDGMISFTELFTGATLLGFPSRIEKQRQYLQQSIDRPTKRQRTGEKPLSWPGDGT